MSCGRHGAAALVACLLVVSKATAAIPADPHASREAKNTLNYLASLPGKSGNRVISGQRHYSVIKTIHDQTGQWVGLLGATFIDGHGSPWLDQSRAASVRQDMYDHWNAGGIITTDLMMHNPKTKGRMTDLNFTDADMDAAVRPGTAINDNLKTWLDAWAVHARWLADRKVPLILRPLLEMNQRYFWWGQLDPVRYKALWDYIFDYLTVTKGLHNLLFAYAASGWDPEKTYADYCPGARRVDIVGYDHYKDLSGEKVLTYDDFAAYRALVGLGKPIAFCEFGPKVANQPSATEKCDYRKMMAGIKAYGPNIVYWQSWSVSWSMAPDRNSHIRELLTDPWTITRDEIPNLK